ALAEQKTGWSDEEILDRVGIRVTTLGAKGVRIDRKGEPPISVGAAEAAAKADPTGVGDACRPGILAAVAWCLPLERAAQIGNAAAEQGLAGEGQQEYELTTAGLLARSSASYGEQSAAEVEPHL